MPQIPAGQASSAILPETTPENEAYAGERVPKFHVETTPDMFGANIGRAVQQLGGTMENVGNDLFERSLAIQKLKNETASIQSDADLTMKIDKANIDFETNNRGANATANIDAHLKSLDDMRNEFRNNLPNDDARRQFDARSLSVMTRGMFQAGRYAASQGQQAYSNSLQAILQSEQQAAARSVDDKEFQLHLDNIDKIEKQFTAWSGRSDQSAANAAFDSKSGAWANRIDYLAKSNPNAALSMFNTHIDELTARDRNFLENKINSQVLVNGTRKVVQETHDGFMNPDSAISQRLVGGAHMGFEGHAGGVDMQFGQNLTSAFTEYERQRGTGQTVKFQSMGRTTPEQAEIYERHMRETGGDIDASPAGRPGFSRHEFGRAADIASDDFSQGFKSWLHQADSNGQTNADKYGLEFLKGRTGANDPNHIQLAGNAPHRQVDIRNVPRDVFVDNALQHGRNLYGNALTPQMEDRIESEARARWNASAEDAILREKQDYDTVLSAAINNNTKTVSELQSAGEGVMDAYNRLDTKLQDQLRRKIEKDEPSDATEVGRLRGMAAYSPDEFVKPETLGYIQNGPFNKRDRQALSQEWGKLQQKPEHDPNVTTAFRILRPGLKKEIAYPSTKEERDIQHQYIGALQTIINDWGKMPGHNGKPPTGQDLEKIGQALLGEVSTRPSAPEPESALRGRPITSFLGMFGVVPPWAGYSGPLYQATPSGERYDEIKSKLKKLGIENPSDELIQQAHIRDLYREKFEGK